VRDSLTARERDVINLLHMGLTNEEIAQRLAISLDGAKYHVSQILSKLGVASREEAAAVVHAERRPWWARGTVWAQMAGATTLLAMGVGLSALAWGVVQTDWGERLDTDFDPQSTATDAASASQILFARIKGEGEIDFDIYVMDSDGSDLTNVTNTPEAPEFYPAWSPNRRQIAFFSRESTSVSPSPSDPKGKTSIQHWYLYVAGVDGSGRRPVAEWFMSLARIPPVWSPDGTQIAFESQPSPRADDMTDIFVVDVDGSDLRNVTNHTATDSGPTWSSDGSRIAFTSDRDGQSGDIYAIGTDDSDLRRLTTLGGHSPAWSPDDSRIAFLSQRDGNSELYVMNVDGSGQTNLSQHDEQDFVLPVGHFAPIWSPDGALIAFLSDRDTATEIYAVKPDGSAVRRLTTKSTADESLHSWSPDSASLIFWAHGALYEVGVDDNQEPRLIADISATIPRLNAGTDSP